MTTYRQMVYYVLDAVKIVSDDSTLNEEHVLFMLDKYRAYILKQKYENANKSSIPTSNYQTLCLYFEEVDRNEGIPCEGQYIRSINKIPDTLDIGNVKISAYDVFNPNITYVTPERFEYAGNTKFDKMFIFATIGPDNYLYMKSNNPQFLYMDKAKFTALFESASEANEYSCDASDECDVMDLAFPLEEALIPAVIEMCVKDVLGAAYRPKDATNNASDDLADIASFVRQNMKERYIKDTQQ